MANTLEELRNGAPTLERSFFQQRADEVGLTAAKVTEYIASIADQEERGEAQTYWDEAAVVGRLDPFMVNAGVHAGLTEEQLDVIYYIGV